MLSLVLKRYYEPLRLPTRPGTLSDKPYMHPLTALNRHRIGSPALCCSSSDTCHPCFPERSFETLPFSSPKHSGLPLMSKRSASPTQLTRLHIGSLSLRPAPLPMGNLQPPVTRTLLPGAKEAYGQFPLQDFNLLEKTVVTAYGHNTVFHCMFF